MRIQLPYIDKKSHFSAIIAAYAAVAAEYNDKVAEDRENGLSGRQPLRAQHRELFIALVNLVSGRMEQTKYVFHSGTSSFLLAMDSRQGYLFSTSRSELSQRTLRSEATIYRLLIRLIEAGVVSKKSHGPAHAFDLVISPDILMVSDELNEKYDPVLDMIGSTENQSLASAMRSFCTQYYNNKNSFNNKEIPEHDVEKTSSLPTHEQTENIYSNTGDSLQDLPDYSKDLSKEKAPVPPEVTPAYEQYCKKLQESRKADEKRLQKFSILLVQCIVKNLFDDKNIYTGEMEKAYKQAEFYFENIANDNSACNAAMDQYRQRVILVRKYLDRKGDRFDFSHIYPAAYLDPESKCGFLITEKWLKDSEKYKKMKRRAKLLRNKENIYRHAIDKFSEYSDPSAYRWWREYLIKRAPETVADYDNFAMKLLKTA